MKLGRFALEPVLACGVKAVSGGCVRIVSSGASVLKTHLSSVLDRGFAPLGGGESQGLFEPSKTPSFCPEGAVFRVENLGFFP